jgi:hypothetical protein
VLETDGTGVDAKLCTDDQDQSNRGPLVEEIKNLLNAFGDHVVKMRRSPNKAAHLLAKLGYHNKVCNVWFGEAPTSIVNQLVLSKNKYTWHARGNDQESKNIHGPMEACLKLFSLG